MVGFFIFLVDKGESPPHIHTHTAHTSSDCTANGILSNLCSISENNVFFLWLCHQKRIYYIIHKTIVHTFWILRYAGMHILFNLRS
jgi:hypothetical protein